MHLKRFFGRRAARLAMLTTLALLPVATLTPASAATMRFQVDTQATEITATVAEPLSALRGSATGAFTVDKGEISGEPADLTGTGHVLMVISAASYRTDSGIRDRAVRDKALEAEQFPTITFESTALRDLDRSSPLEGRATLVGKLTLHGVTRQLSAPIHVQLDSNNQLTAEGEASFKLSDFSIKRLALIPGLLTIGDEVSIRFRVVARPS